MKTVLFISIPRKDKLMPVPFKKARKKQLLYIATDDSMDLDTRYKAARELQTRRDWVLYERQRRKFEYRYTFGG